MLPLASAACSHTTRGPNDPLKTVVAEIVEADVQKTADCIMGEIVDTPGVGTPAREDNYQGEPGRIRIVSGIERRIIWDLLLRQMDDGKRLMIVMKTAEPYWMEEEPRYRALKKAIRNCPAAPQPHEQTLGKF